MNSLLVLDASPLCAMTFKEHVDHDLIITLKKTSTIHKIGDKAKLTKLEARFPHNQPYIQPRRPVFFNDGHYAILFYLPII